jgi:hypothetical protein
MEKFIFGGVVETHPGNNNYRSFHMKHQLINKEDWFSFEYLGSESGNPKNLLPCIYITATALYNIQGIKSVAVRPYNFSLSKAEAYTWEELYPAIKLAMAKYLPATY